MTGDVKERVDAYLKKVGDVIKARGRNHRDSHDVASTTAELLKIVITEPREEWDAATWYKAMQCFKRARKIHGIQDEDSSTDLIGYQFLEDDFKDRKHKERLKEFEKGLP